MQLLLTMVTERRAHVLGFNVGKISQDASKMLDCLNESLHGILVISEYCS